MILIQNQQPEIKNQMMEISIEDFKTIRDMIRERCGIWLTDSKINFLKIRLNHRLKDTNMETVKDYYYYIKYDPNADKEMDDLIDAVTVNETYFYREEAQLEDFNHEIVPRILEQKKGLSPVSIWSAGCSTGEEPYTLAMLLMEHPLKISPSMINILGSDINHAVLRSAREGFYSNYSVRHLPPYYLLKYFDKNPDGTYVLKEQLKQLIKFAHINFMDSFATGRIRDIDCIFCRNVIIYFDDEDKGRCINNLYRSLTKGGYLFLGHSESLGRISNLFEVVRLKQTIAYKKL